MWDVKEEQVQYDVRGVDSKKMGDGIWWYTATWCDGDTTEEPRVNLEGAEAMVDEFERKWFEFEANNGKPAMGSRVARKAVLASMVGAGAGDTELKKAMLMMAQSVSAMVKCQQVKTGTGTGPSAATDGKLAD